MRRFFILITMAGFAKSPNSSLLSCVFKKASLKKYYSFISDNFFIYLDFYTPKKTNVRSIFLLTTISNSFIHLIKYRG